MIWLEMGRRQSQEEPGEYNSVWSHEDGFGAPQYHTVRIRHLPYPQLLLVEVNQESILHSNFLLHVTDPSNCTQF